MVKVWPTKEHSLHSDGLHAADKPPLYFQHEGHSRTIVGMERHEAGEGVAPQVRPSEAEEPVACRQQFSSVCFFLLHSLNDLRAYGVELVRPRITLFNLHY